MASASQVAEKRPLKRSRQGVPPDVYLQEPKQEEDKLGADKLKNGYCNHTHSYEYESLFNNSNPKQPKLDRLDEYTTKSIQAYNQIIVKKSELNASLDRDRKKQWGKDSIGLWHAAAGKQKEKDMWFKDLAGGSKSLISLAKRPPFFNKKEEAFSFLCDFNIPMSRAIWFLKMSNAATQYHQNPTKKKNSSVDTNLEHTQMFLKFLKDLLGKLASYYDAAPGSVSVESTPEYRTQWPYFTRLARHMYEEGLFDRHDMVSWIVDVFSDKCITKPETGGVLKLFIPFMMQYMDGIVQNVLLSRRCAMVACKKLQQLYMDHDDSNLAGIQTPGGNRVPSPVQCYQDYLNCGFHRQLVLSLSSMVHMIMLDCPAALVWNYWNCNETKYALLCGSPLDALPCAPSMLPTAPGPAVENLRQVLRLREQEIIRRSRAVENHWSLNRSQQSGFGNLVSTVLEIIEALDNHKFEKNEDMDQLYSNVFPSAPKEGEDSDDIVRIQLLCHWAISAQRVGSHRALVVVRLLEKRQEDMRKENVPSEPVSYPFQQFLYAFLENEAPSAAGPSFPIEFFSATLLFSELIRADLFSHDLYVSWLIANGEVNSSSPVCLHISRTEYEAGSERAVGDQSWFGEKVRTPMSTASSAPDSMEQTAPSSVDSMSQDPTDNTRIRTGEWDGLTRHQRFLLNFPIPQDEDYRHECNQRQTLLWGFGDERETHRHSLKKLTKELCKNWLKKNCYEVNDKGTKLKRKAPLDQLADTIAKFRSLVYYDQVVVTGLCADAFVDLLREFTERDGSTLPSSDSLDVLLGLMENATNIYGIVDLAEEMVDLLISVERLLKKKDNQLAGSYGPQLALTLAGYLRHHYAFLLLCDSEAKTILNGVIRQLEALDVIKDSCRPSTSSDRCLMIFACNLCKVLQPKEDILIERLLHNMPSKGSQAAASNAKFNAHFFKEQLDNPKRPYDATDMRNKLANDAGNRYSFVVNTFLVAKQLGRDLERLNDLAVLCANVTSTCALLETEWLGAIRALCCSSVAGASISQGFNDLLIAINVEDPSSHYAIATLTMLLASRFCFNVEVLIMCLIRSSFAAMIKSDQPGKSDVEAEAGVCLGLRIVTAVMCMDDQALNQTGNYRLRLNSDRYMLSEAHDIMNGEAVATILITICSIGIDTKQRRSDASVGDGSRESVVDLASQSLVVICEQEWVTRLCLNLTDNLRAKFFNHKHLRQNNRGQHLLRLAIRRKYERPVIQQLQAVSESKKGLILKLLSTLSVWNMQATTLDLQQLLREVSPESSKNPQQASIEMAALMSQIGLCCRELFSNQSHKSGDAPSDNSSTSSPTRSVFSLPQVTNFWLVAPLISRLPSGVQGKVLNEAASMLESGQTNRKERIQQSAWLLSQQPFLSLVLTCLRGQDEQRESLVNSLLKQLQDLAQRAKDDPTLPYQRDFGPERDGLLLRLSLVGGMFETVCKSSNCDMWALLLLQL
uniref:Mediator complex subunit Med12 domain-containing protein n=1 Tax=Plectus sambesii TaxID=2011161 RepID=A0A914UQ26_9BILA